MKTPIDVHIENGIGELVLNNPPVNAFDSAGWFAIADALDDLGADDAVRGIVVSA